MTTKNPFSFRKAGRQRAYYALRSETSHRGTGLAHVFQQVASAFFWRIGHGVRRARVDISEER
jgi:hypothetical protein